MKVSVHVGVCLIELDGDADEIHRIVTMLGIKDLVHRGLGTLPLDAPLSMLELSVRATNCLESGNINCVGDIVKLTVRELRMLRYMGDTTIKEIVEKLQKHGIILASEVPS